eukprot:TRINITY_DN3879_c1_g1_i1.p1 TRINITY_DN3879_c1_g1~~TRINITY_DN3879_c1_g1_i1.p1  ORF type:complete len:712 (-),score=141.57 TRINITY_DN3879_c1_g1_i1:285-2420(-)
MSKLKGSYDLSEEMMVKKSGGLAGAQTVCTVSEVFEAIEQSSSDFSNPLRLLQKFQRIDRDGDGNITLRELLLATAGHQQRSTQRKRVAICGFIGLMVAVVCLAVSLVGLYFLCLEAAITAAELSKELTLLHHNNTDYLAGTLATSVATPPPHDVLPTMLSGKDGGSPVATASAVHSHDLAELMGLPDDILHSTDRVAVWLNATTLYPMRVAMLAVSYLPDRLTRTTITVYPVDRSIIDRVVVYADGSSAVLTNPASGVQWAPDAPAGTSADPAATTSTPTMWPSDAAEEGDEMDRLRTARSLSCDTESYLPPTPAGSGVSCTTPVDGFRGTCLPVTSCTGATFNGLCPGSAKCCVAEKRPVVTPTEPRVSLATFRSLFQGVSAVRAAAMHPYFEAVLEQREITTCTRIAAFVAQVSHESAGLRYFEELASGAAYEGRRDLGNTQSGDGVRYKGRGPIQLTGRANYASASAALSRDFVQHPEEVCFPSGGWVTTGWFWGKNDLNSYADSGDFVGLTKRINGGTNGLSDRQEKWAEAKRALERSGECAAIDARARTGSCGAAVTPPTTATGSVTTPVHTSSGSSTGASSSPSSLPRCARTEGWCMDTRTASCARGLVTGECPGSSNIVCCPDTPAVTRCANDAGQCLDMNQNTCPVAFRGGLCPGASNIRCCPDVKCSDNSGLCVNVDRQSCFGSLASGLCPGAANIRCCRS